MCCDFTEGECGHMGKKCIKHQYDHLSEMTAREFCGCTNCKKKCISLVAGHNERAERLRQNEGKYIPAWRLLGL